MYHDEAKVMLEYIRKLWDTWNPNIEQAEEWVCKLKQFDENVVRVAIDAYRSEKAGSFKWPNLYDLTLYCKLAIPRKQSEASKPFVPEAGVLYGKAAREKAYMNILDGPDTPGRRWLKRHLGIRPLKKDIPDKMDFSKTIEGIDGMSKAKEVECPINDVEIPF